MDEDDSDGGFQLNMGYLGLGVGILAILLFVFAGSLTNEWECQDIMVDLDGDGVEEEAKTCRGKYTIYDAPSSKIRCFSCCVLVPLGLMLSLVGMDQNAVAMEPGQVGSKMAEFVPDEGVYFPSEGMEVGDRLPLVSKLGIGLNSLLIILGTLAFILVVIASFLALSAFT